MQGHLLLGQPSDAPTALAPGNPSYVGTAVANIHDAARVPSGKPLPLTAVAAALSGGSRAVLCPAIDVRLPANTRRRVTDPGCPCSYNNGTDDSAALANVCPAGYVCSRQDFRGLLTDDPSAVQLRALCVSCTLGKYCPEGSSAAAVFNESSFDCPAGSYCPTPAARLPCPAGYFCGPRAMAPTHCNDTE
ncbi:hypothetical protein GPECTOR_100g2 [Gonium pectorale]|uniref:Uncharacterized protein n=1 Tax=Gonium pectorale TaxID=33097 RepID=A0A150FZZ6_GONPE|nr:hypothetical protein GPECTOR_100g2 [Gonium pectorale]|eukprot:KXZ43148.1 hypothetical protein GPECTOR_100g2 [Gonium pectorale]